MARPVKWSRDLHSIREHAKTSRTETWSRQDLEYLFHVGRSTAQTLARAIGEVETVAGAHFVDRAGLVDFLDEMIAADSVDEALRKRLEEARKPPKRHSLKVTLPQDLRNARIGELPAAVEIRPGELVIHAPNMMALLENLAVFARVLENDFASVEAHFTLPRPQPGDDELREFIGRLRKDGQDQPG